MTADGASDRQQQWALAVRRSFGIPDLAAEHEAREALIGYVEARLHGNGWQSPARSIAQPIVGALLALGASGELDDLLLPAELRLSATGLTGRDAAYRLLETGMKIVDPENLVFDVRGEYPPEVLAAAQQLLEQVSLHVRGQPFGG